MFLLRGWQTADGMYFDFFHSFIVKIFFPARNNNFKFTHQICHFMHLAKIAPKCRTDIHLSLGRCRKNEKWADRQVEMKYSTTTNKNKRGGGSFSQLFQYKAVSLFRKSIPGGPQKTGTVNFLGLCSDQQLSFYTLLDRTSFCHYNNTKIIKFGWELFVLWVISYGLSFSGFTISLSLIVPRKSGKRANPENDSP